jgi:predicted RNA-binding protein with TRAM domain
MEYSGERRGFSSPINVGETYDAKIEDVGREGDGIARIEGFVCFVPNTKKGDEVKIRVTKVSRRVAFAEVVTE